MDYFQNNPTNSLNDAARDLNKKRSTIWKCLKTHKIKPFKVKYLHTLLQGDRERRLEYCLWAQGEYLNNRNFLDNILFTDEATFTTNGVFSSQNTRYWAENNPYFTINCKSQYSFKVNVFCGITSRRVIGPFFFNENLNGVLFLQFLRETLDSVIDELPLAESRDLIMQLDGAPIHTTRQVVEWLNHNFPNRCVKLYKIILHFCHFLFSQVDRKK